MPKALVIVESPAKAKTIGKFLGRNFTVQASMGHVRDLPKSQFGVDIEAGFVPKYITVRGQGKTLQALRAAAKKVDRVYLATDPDREGEAISWHLADALGLEPHAPHRIEFHEITRQAVERALRHPRPINMDLVNAQQARRILDRLVGYRLSPLLWEKVRRGLSAGRVQSVALRLICDREAEIQAFVPQEYWTISAWLTPGEDGRFLARLVRRGEEKLDIRDGETAKSIAGQLERARFQVQQVVRRERLRHPAPPFTTSTLQQEASRKLGFTARRTMSVAQQLYEGLDVGPDGTVGLITYLRTDSTRVAEEAQVEARGYITQAFGPHFCPERPPQYKSRAGAQGAHEAIRPTSVWRRPESIKEYLSRDQYRLYKLIWERFLASQMAPAVLDTVTVDIIAKIDGVDVAYVLRATGSTVKFPGFMTLYIEKTEEEGENEEESAILPPLHEGQLLQCTSVETKQHWTQPPPRYTEAMLVRTLEELGIGRPSTYVQIIDTIQKRGYVSKQDRRFVPTELGRLVVDLLKEHFPDIVDVEFTARIEEKLDRIEEGELDWVTVLREFYEPFAEDLAQARQAIEHVELPVEETDEVCEQCGRRMVVKWGRFGKFLACPGFPECKNTRPLLIEVGVDCPNCGAPLVERKSRRGRTFYGCSRYPECHFTVWQRPVRQRCPRCGSLMVEQPRRGRGWVVCSDRQCGHSMALDASEAANGAAVGTAGPGTTAAASSGGDKGGTSVTTSTVDRDAALGDGVARLTPANGRRTGRAGGGASRRFPSRGS